MSRFAQRRSLTGLLAGGLCLVTAGSFAEVNGDYPYYPGPSYFFPDQCVPSGMPNGQVPNGSFEFALQEVPLFPINDFENCSQTNPGSSTLTPWHQQIILSERLFKLSGIINNRLRGGGGGGPVLAATGGGDLAGRAAGDMLSNLSAWVSYGHTFADNDRPSTEFDALQHNLLAGMDYAFSDRLLAGLVFGYESSDFETPFNAGDMLISGYTVAPYIAYLLTDNFSVDATAGYTNLGIRQSRTDFISQTAVKGNTSVDRWFVAGNLNAFTYWHDFALNGRVGLVYAEDRQRGFTESGGPTAQTIGSETFRFGQVQVGGEVAYVVHAIEPFASAYYQYDFEREKIRLNQNQAQPSNDRDDVRVSAGLRYFGANGLSGILEYSRIVGRQDFGADTINLMLRMQF